MDFKSLCTRYLDLFNINWSDIENTLLFDIFLDEHLNNSYMLLYDLLITTKISLNKITVLAAGYVVLSYVDITDDYFFYDYTNLNKKEKRIFNDACLKYSFNKEVSFLSVFEH